MNIENKIQKAEETANLAKDEYQKITYQEVLRYYLLSDEGSETNSIVTKEIGDKKSNNGANQDEIPDAYLVAQHGDIKHQVAWALMRLIENGDKGNVKNVRNIIDLELSQKKPSRPYTSNKLAQLVPKYLSRRKPESGKGYEYLPNSNTINIFDDLTVTEEE